MKQTHSGWAYTFFELPLPSTYPDELKHTCNSVSYLTLAVNSIKNTIVGSYQ